MALCHPTVPQLAPLAAGVSSTWDMVPTVASNCLKYILEYNSVQKSLIQKYQLLNITKGHRGAKTDDTESSYMPNCEERPPHSISLA